MNYRWKIAIAPIFLAVLSGCGILGISTDTEPAQTPGESFFAGDAILEQLRADVFTLSADSMRGREAATDDERRAAEYLAGRLREMGVQPGGDGDSVR
ncbi:MAG TPA: hypothetical protein VF190_15790, partial [Rhodothermales bacterium]